MGGSWGTTHFIEGMGVGLLTRAMAELDDAALAHLNTRDGRVRAGLRWLQDRLWDYHAKELRITLDGKNLSGQYVLLAPDHRCSWPSALFLIGSTEDGFP